MSVTAGVSEAAIAVSDKLRGKIGQTKVKRYWPGKAPEWADDELIDIKNPSSSSSLEKAFPSHEHDPHVVPNADDDRRLRRLAESRSERLDEVRADHRRIRQAETVSTIEEEEENNHPLVFEDNDEDALEERRKRIREKLLRKEQEEAALLPDEPEEEEELEEESEYETDSEEEQTGIAMVKPVFIPKSQQDTIAERERLEEEERKLEQLVKKRLEERKVETKQIVVEMIREMIRKDEEIRKNLETEANVADIDTDDELNEAEEYEAWKAREIARIKRDREDREARMKAKKEVEKVRNMTEEERREWERRNPKPQSAPKRKRRFMQKYYHKGAFFQSENDDRAATAGSDDIYRRDFSEPTGEDKMDKTILPEVMQVKRFGCSGRTKWTHLVNEDTTDWSNPWTANGPLRAKYNTKMAGLNAPIEKPKGSKKLKHWGTSKAMSSCCLWETLFLIAHEVDLISSSSLGCITSGPTTIFYCQASKAFNRFSGKASLARVVVDAGPAPRVGLPYPNLILVVL